jgi:hypothetical protein
MSIMASNNNCRSGSGSSSSNTNSPQQRHRQSSSPPTLDDSQELNNNGSSIPRSNNSNKNTATTMNINHHHRHQQLQLRRGGRSSPPPPSLRRPRWMTLKFMIPVCFALSLLGGTFLHSRTVLQQYVDIVAMEQQADEMVWMTKHKKPSQPQQLTSNSMSLRRQVSPAASSSVLTADTTTSSGNGRILHFPEEDLLDNSTSSTMAVVHTNEDDQMRAGDESSFFSACLIIMDDNHWLIEWLAYHYHVLNLRRLVFVRDPLSLTSPNDILQRYASTGKMFIEEWTDDDFLPKWIVRKSTQYTGKWLHLNRQKHFYGHCLRHLHPKSNINKFLESVSNSSFSTTKVLANHPTQLDAVQRRYGDNTKSTWVMLTDTDEFVRVNPQRFTLPIHVRQRAGHVVDFLYKRKVHLDTAMSTSSTNQHGSAACLLAPRIQVSSLEFNETIPPEEGGGSTVSQEAVTNHVAPIAPAPFDGRDFLTFRWLQHNGHEMEAGKNILYLPLLKLPDLPRSVESVHYTLPGLCPKNTGDHLHTSHLQIQHYLGTFEQFTYRNDPRDVQDDRWWKWHTRGKSPEPFHYDVGMTDWLSGFVATQGVAEAQRLLYRVGQLEPRPGVDNATTSATQDRFANMESLLKSSQLVPRSVYRRHEQLLLKSGVNASSIVVNVPASKVAEAAALAQQQRQQQNNTFGACLITKDDNHWLIEWLAYHYHVLPLRHVFIVHDPTSKTSIDGILERWKGRLPIEQWYDEDFIPAHIYKKVDRGDITPARLHRYRQEFFYAKCLQEYRARRHDGKVVPDDAKNADVTSELINVASNRVAWVLLTDTDEFVRPNPYISHIVTPLFRKGAVATFLRTQIRSKRTGFGKFKAPACLYVPRIQITSQEYNSTATGRKLPPLVPENERFEKLYSDQDFLTTRWLYHNGRELINGNNHDGKNIINLEHLENDADFPDKISNVHHVLPDHCRSTWNTSEERLHDPTSWLVIHHYLGTLEQYTFRDDPRDEIPGRPKRVDAWRMARRGLGEQRDEYDSSSANNATDMVLDTYMRTWVAGFVQSVGAYNAIKLLEGVGKLKPNPMWKEVFERIWQFKDDIVENV